MSQSPSGVKSTAISRRPKRERLVQQAPRSQRGFQPSVKQLVLAKQLVVRSLKRRWLHASNEKEAAYRILNELRSEAHPLGRNPGDKTTTVRQAMVELTRAGRISYNGRYYRLV